MAVSQQLMMAILSMDTYNRGAGLRLSGNQIGTAIITREDTSSAANAAGFYAAAYETEFGTVISYRGTDNPMSLPNLNPWSTDPGSDIINGWILGAGDYSANQAFLAGKFLASVTADPHKGDILLTGHSLGGGLAGFLSQLYGNEAFLVDPMTYLAAARNLAFYYGMEPFQVTADFGEERINSWIRYAHELFNLNLSAQTLPNIIGLTHNASGIYMPGEVLDNWNRTNSDYPWLQKLVD